MNPAADTSVKNTARRERYFFLNGTGKEALRIDAPSIETASRRILRVPDLFLLMEK